MPSTEYRRSVAVASTVEITPIMPLWKHLFPAACCLLTVIGCQESTDDVAASVPVDSSEARSIQQPASSKEDTPSQSAAFAAADAERVRPTVYEFCTKCHAWPEPEHFPRWIWKTEINKAMGFYRQAKRAGRADYDSPPLEDIIGYYESYAPETITVDLSLWNVDASDHEFNPMPLSLGESENRPAIARTLWKSSTGERPNQLLTCEMLSGSVNRITFHERRPEVTTLATLAHPATVVETDLNQDGNADYVVAELGSFYPDDHKKGSVVWLKPTGDPDSTAAAYEPIHLLTGVGRVADVGVADFDADGDSDLIVAEFGWRETGGIHLLVNYSDAFDGADASAEPRFRRVTFDPRHGASHLEVTDINGDGHPDFFALISQEHERVEAFINTGSGSFQRQEVFDAQNAAFGSTSMTMADIDLDGDEDLVLTTGDYLDSLLLQPWHGVYWLENTGNFPFEVHKVSDLPGATIAAVGDFDADGDQDIVASACLVTEPNNRNLPSVQRTLTVLCEQTSPGTFATRVISRDDTGGLAAAAGDFDGDSRTDFLTAAFFMPGEYENRKLDAAPITVYWNPGVADTASSRSAASNGPAGE